MSVTQSHPTNRIGACCQGCYGSIWCNDIVDFQSHATNIIGPSPCDDDPCGVTIRGNVQRCPIPRQSGVRIDRAGVARCGDQVIRDISGSGSSEIHNALETLETLRSWGSLDTIFPRNSLDTLNTLRPAERVVKRDRRGRDRRRCAGSIGRSHYGIIRRSRNQVGICTRRQNCPSERCRHSGHALNHLIQRDRVGCRRIRARPRIVENIRSGCTCDGWGIRCCNRDAHYIHKTKRRAVSYTHLIQDD